MVTPKDFIPAMQKEDSIQELKLPTKFSGCRYAGMQKVWYL